MQRAASHVSGHHQHLDLLINAAGILHSSDMSPGTAFLGWTVLYHPVVGCPVVRMHQHLLSPVLSCADAETALSRVQAEDMLTNYRINAMGPILVSKVR